MAVKLGAGGHPSRGHSRRRKFSPMADINVTPMVDVMLVLLIIFMVTAPLITPSMIALPKVGRAPSQPQNPVQIQISKDEAVLVKIKTDSVPSTVRNVAADIARLEPGVKADGAQAVPVVISADKSIKYETVVQVMDNLQKAGVSRVGLSVQTSSR